MNTQGISNESFSQQEDIKENGLINPPVVTPDNVLIAGERRVRACEYAGYNQIEVRVMSVKDNEHQLKMEISENENRKEFTFSERIDWAKRLERIEKAKARERQKQSKNIVSEEKGEAAAITAKKSGFGSKETYRQAKYIYENASKELIGQLDEGRISINKAYTTLKQEKEELQQDFKEICGKFGIKI
ncbi:ParB N-terminal domain-containing protein [Clostridium sp. DJ247]|nr:ParB N-terminal domain-containing protein [Clostridium sp. DJ247]